MAEIEEEMDDPQEQPWEERTLHLLQDSKIDQEISAAKAQKKGGRRHRVRWMQRPMAIPEVILELQDEDARENALRCLSNFLLERREDDPDNYYRTGFLLFNSFGSMTILTQEVISFFRKMTAGNLNARSSKRVANVLTLFQSIAANKETRRKFVNSCVPNFLIPMILYESTEEVYTSIQAISLSVIGILCQTREPEIIQWAIDSDMVEVCRTAIEIGSELSKVIAMHIIEAILQDESGITYICNHMCGHLLIRLMETWENLVYVLVVHQDFSPRLLFHIIRCYVMLCKHSRGFTVVMESLPDPITKNFFHDITEEFPVVQNLLNQLLVNVCIEKIPIPEEKVLVHHPVEEEEWVPGEKFVHMMEATIPMKPMHFGVSDSLYNDRTPFKVIDVNQENWMTLRTQYPSPTSTEIENYSSQQKHFRFKKIYCDASGSLLPAR